jgi:hypothetical protein
MDRSNRLPDKRCRSRLALYWPSSSNSPRARCIRNTVGRGDDGRIHDPLRRPVAAKRTLPDAAMQLVYCSQHPCCKRRERAFLLRDGTESLPGNSRLRQVRIHL